MAVKLALSDEELTRYSRQLALPELGVDAQLKLKKSSVIVIGAGALGTTVAGYLAAAGVGRLGIVDGDAIELSNLQRQLLYFTPDIGGGKADNLTAKLGLLNPEILVDSYPARLEEANASALLESYDLAVDCSDNLETRFLINRAAVTAGMPLVEGGVVGLLGLVTSIVPGSSACYRCVFEDDLISAEEEGCEQAGILGPVAGVVGSLQAVEAIKMTVGLGEPLLNRVLQIDALSLSFQTVKTKRLENCPVCGLT